MKPVLTTREKTAPVVKGKDTIPVVLTDSQEYEIMNNPSVMMDDEVITMDSETAYMDDVFIRKGRYKPILRSE